MSILSLFLGTLFKWLFGLLTKPIPSSVLDLFSGNITKAIHATSEVYEIMNSLVNECGVSKVLILKSENGGGVPKLGSPIYGSVVAEVVRKPSKSILHTWQRQRVDESYNDVLNQIIKNEEGITLRTNELDDGYLKNIYLASNITESYVFLISKTKKSVVYGSIYFSSNCSSVTNKFEDLKPEQKDYLRYAINRIREIFNEYPKISY